MASAPTMASMTSTARRSFMGAQLSNGPIPDNLCHSRRPPRGKTGSRHNIPLRPGNASLGGTGGTASRAMSAQGARSIAQPAGGHALLVGHAAHTGMISARCFAIQHPSAWIVHYQLTFNKEIAMRSYWAFSVAVPLAWIAACSSTSGGFGPSSDTDPGQD